MKKNNICIHEEKKLTFLLIMSVKAQGGGGLKAITDMVAKNISYFGRLPLPMYFLFRARIPASEPSRQRGRDRDTILLFSSKIN